MTTRTLRTARARVAHLERQNLGLRAKLRTLQNIFDFEALATPPLLKNHDAFVMICPIQTGGSSRLCALDGLGHVWRWEWKTSEWRRYPDKRGGVIEEVAAAVRSVEPAKEA